MAERDTPIMRAFRPIEHQPDTERTDDAAGMPAHAVQAHGGAAQFLVGGLHGAGG